MRHNISLSIRNKKMVSLAFFAVLAVFFMLVHTVPPVYAQAQNGAQVKDTDQVTGDPNSPGPDNSDSSANVPGQGFADKDFGPQVEEESAVWMIIKTLLVLGLLGGGFYLFYKFISQKVGLNIAGQEAIQTLSIVPVGPNKTLQIVDVGGKIFLIGVTDNNINLLTEIKEKDEIDRIRLLSSRSTPVKGKNFQEFITDQMGWIIGKINEKRKHGFSRTSVEEIPEKDIDMSYINEQKARLKKINHEDEE